MFVPHQNNFDFIKLSRLLQKINTQDYYRKNQFFCYFRFFGLIGLGPVRKKRGEAKNI